MKYYKVTFENNYCGCDVEELYIFEDDMTEQQIDNCLDEDLACYAGDYCYVAEGYSADGWDSEEEEEWHYDNCLYTKEEISKEEYKELKEEGY